MSEYKKKLIEVSLPLEAINRESAREKSIRQGHPSTLHLWWARRPLAAARAVLFAQLVDDPSAHPDQFPTEALQEVERQRLFALIEQLVAWENTNDSRVLKEARDEIQRSCPDGLPPVGDPFAGGGTIPLEAKRLGLKAIANDLNPLPFVLNTVLLEVVGRFSNRVPVSGGLDQSPQQALAKDVSYWASHLEHLAAETAGGNYPEGAGSGATPLVYFWARTVQCPNPACGVEIPLVGSWIANGRKGQETEFVPVLRTGNLTYDVEVRKGRWDTPPTMTRQGGRCPSCGGQFPLSHVKHEGMTGRMGVRLLAIQEQSGGIRYFRPATDEDRRRASIDAPSLEWLESDLSTHPQYMAPPRYGLSTFSDLFLPRQLAAMNAFVGALDDVRGRIETQAAELLGGEDPRSFAEGGKGAAAYADAVTILLALSIGRLANRASTLCIWDAPGQTVQQVFARQAYSMTWFFAEANPFSGATGSYQSQVKYLTQVIERVPNGEGIVTQGPAQDVVFPDGVAVSTDPPYYDSVPYADLSDYFIVWLRKMLEPVLPDVFATVLSPKAQELVADHVRHGSKSAAALFFDSGLAQVFSRLRSVHSNDIPMTVYYAFKADDSGWETFLSSLVASGWTVTGTWPIRTEQAGGLRHVGRNALASSVVVACRKRAENSPEATRRTFLAALKSDLPGAMLRLQQGSIAPVDMAQAAIGPGMEIYSRYSRVSEVDGSAMSVGSALQLINQTLDEVLSAQEGDFDATSRFCIKWFEQRGWNEGPAGEADVLARAVSISPATLERGGIFKAIAGRARLLEPSEMSAGWDPMLDKDISVWEVAVRTGYALQTEGVDRAGEWLAAAATRVDLGAVKELSYLLFSICEKKGWAEAALLFNGLGSSWSELVTASTASRSAPQQSALKIGAVEEGE